MNKYTWDLGIHKKPDCLNSPLMDTINSNPSKLVRCASIADLISNHKIGRFLVEDGMLSDTRLTTLTSYWRKEDPQSLEYIISRVHYKQLRKALLYLFLPKVNAQDVVVILDFYNENERSKYGDETTQT